MNIMNIMNIMNKTMNIMNETYSNWFKYKIILNICYKNKKLHIDSKIKSNKTYIRLYILYEFFLSFSHVQLFIVQ